MRIQKIGHKLIFGLLVSVCFWVLVPETVFGQKEKMGTVQYTAPKGWKKTAKENIVVFSEINETTGRFCTITLYGATPGTGDPKGDFTREWNNLVVKPWGADQNPKMETESENGWTAIAGASAIELQGAKSMAFLTVFSRGAIAVSVLGITNDEPYLQDLVAFTSSVDIETPRQTVAAAPARSASGPPATDESGHLIIPLPTRQLTISDLAGEWGQNDGINTRYVYRDSGGYAGADSLHFTNKMTLTAEGGFYNDFFAIQNGRKIKEDTGGTFFVKDRVLYIKQRGLEKYVIRGWLELSDMTILEICGPWPDDDPIPAEIFTNPNQGANLDKKWVRRK